MNLRSLNNIDVVAHILEFERQNFNDAKKILELQYDIPQTDSFRITSGVFKKMSSLVLSWNDYSFDSLWIKFKKFAEDDIKLLKSQMSKNFNLSEKEFATMIYSLKHGDESVFEHIFLTHMQDCIVYIKNKYKISHEQAYDCSMDTLLEFRKKLLANKISYGNLRFLFTRMASQFYLKSLKVEERNNQLNSLVESEDNEQDLQLLEKSLNQLGDGCKSLLKMNFYNKLSLKEIAEMQDKTSVSLRKQKQRCIYKLKSIFLKFSSNL